MDEFDFEELVADMLGITDDEREDDDVIYDRFYESFGIDMQQGYELTRALLVHTPIINDGLSGKKYHAFVSKTDPLMLMRIEAKD